MNRRLLTQVWRWQALKLVVISIALAGWGFLAPVFYVAFSEPFEDLIGSGAIPNQFVEFGGGDLLSLSGAMALLLIHPIFLALIGVFAVGLASTAVAGERQRGTLEVLLARPLSRRATYVTLAVAIAVLVAVPITTTLLGMLLGAYAQGVQDEIEAARLPLVWLNAFLLWATFASFGLAASVIFNRSAPAIAITLAYTIGSYFLDILGSLWEAAEPLRPYSPFNHFQPKEILSGNADPFDFALLATLTVVPIVFSLIVFPRRDIPAPS